MYNSSKVGNMNKTYTASGWTAWLIVAMWSSAMFLIGYGVGTL